MSGWGQFSEERVTASSGFDAEAKPVPLGPVAAGLVAFFDLAAKDDAAI